MQEIQSTIIRIKRNTGYENDHCLVHDGKNIVAFCDVHQRASVPENLTMLVGTRVELQAEIKQLDLKPIELRPRVPRPPRKRPEERFVEE